MPPGCFMYQWKHQYKKDYEDIKEFKIVYYRSKLGKIFEYKYISTCAQYEKLYSAFSRVKMRNQDLIEVFENNLNLKIRARIGGPPEWTDVTESRLNLEISGEALWPQKIEIYMWKISAGPMYNSIREFFTRLNAVVLAPTSKISAQNLLKALTSVNFASSAERARIQDYQPTIKLVNSTEVHKKEVGILLVNCKKPIKHLMELFDQADRIYSVQGNKFF